MKLDTSSYYPESLLPEDSESDKVRGGNEAEGVPDAGEIQESDSESSRRPGPGHLEPLPTSFETAADGFSVFLSWVLVPLLMPVYGMLLAFNLSILAYTPLRTKVIFTLIAFAFNVAVPALLVFLLKRMGLVSDMGLNGRKERFVPYIITIFCMGGTGAFMWYKGAPMWLVMFFAGGALAALVNMIVNFRWKISAHAAAIAGVVALIIRIMHDGFPQQGTQLCLIVSIALSGLLGSARIWLGRHTVWQVVAGYTVGFTSVLLMTLIG